MSTRRRFHRCCGFLLAGALVAGMLPGRGLARAGTVDENIDLALGALESPVVQRLLIPPGTQEGAPVTPPYKQEPPAAQGDFRPRPPVPPPAPPPPPPCKGPNCP